MKNENAIEQFAEAIMNAAGSSLKHYMPATKEAIIAAVGECYLAGVVVGYMWNEDAPGK